MSNNSDKKLTSLSANHNVENISIYEEYIKNALEELVYEKTEKNQKEIEKKNKNIAISGNYGAGKSSIIKSYFHKHGEEKVVYVTMGSYIENTSDEDISQIELGIIQQIIFTAQPEKLPFSRITRIDKNERRVNIVTFLISIIMTLLICGIFYMNNIDVIKEFILQPNGIIIICFIIPTLWLLIGLSINNLFKKFSINTISLAILNNTNAKVQKNDTKDESLLNKYTDELINFFLNTDYEIIVFEDIDRLKDSQRVFSKLRELNLTINNALKKKTVQFIYAVSDTLFDNSENRTKFFDIIIPIVSYGGIGNYKHIFKQEISKNKSDFPEGNEEINDICPYINNTRMLIDIVNEYRVYYNNNKSNINNNSKTLNEILKKELLYLCAYKVIYPSKFNDLLDNKGYLSYYLSEDFMNEFKSKETENLKKELISLQNSYDKLGQTTISNNKIFNNIIKENIKEFGYSEYQMKNNAVLFDGEEKCKIIDFINNIENYVTDLKIKKIKIGIYDEEKIFGLINKEDFLNWYTVMEEYGTLSKEQVLKKIKAIENKIDNYNYNAYDIEEKIKILESQELPENYKKNNSTKEEKQKEDIKEKKLNAFEKHLIRTGIINKECKRLITIRQQNEISVNDDNVVSNIKNNKLENNIKIDNPNDIYEELTIYDYLNDSICIPEIINITLDKKINELSNRMNYYFKNLNRYKMEFLINLDKVNKDTFSKIKYFLPIIWERYETHYDLSSEDTKYILIKTLEHKDITSDLFLPSSKVVGLLEEGYVNSKEFEENITLIESTLKNVEFKISPTVNLTPDYKELMKLIYENKKFSICKNHIEPICKSLNFVYEPKRILSSLAENENNIIYNEICNKDNIKDVISILKDKQQEDPSDFMCEFINKLSLSENESEEILKVEKNKIVDLSKIDNHYYNVIKKLNKYEICWGNLFEIFKDNFEEFDEYLIDTIKENIEILAKQKYNSDEIDITFDNAIFSSEDFEYEELEKIVPTILDGLTYRNIEDFSKNSIQVLIKNNGIKFEKSEYYKELLNNEDYTNEEKGAVLVNSYEYLKDYVIQNLNEDIILYFLDSDISPTEKVKYMLNYIHSIEDFPLAYSKLKKIIKDNNLTISDEDIQMIFDSLEDENEKIKMFIKHCGLLKINTDVLNILEIMDTNLCDKLINHQDISVEKTDIIKDFLNCVKESKNSMIDKLRYKGLNSSIIEVVYK